MSKCQRCNKELASPQSLWNHKRRCYAQSTYSRKPQDVADEYPVSAKRQRTKREIIGYSDESDDDDTPVKLKPINTDVDDARKAKALAILD